MNLAELLTRSDRIAIRLDDRTLTYAELDDAAARAAALLKAQGVEPGDRVGLMAPNVPEFAIAYYGALRAGAVVVPMNPLLKEREVEHYLTDSGAKLVLTPDTDYAGHAPDYDDRRPRPAATPPSCSTRAAPPGAPKGAQLTHANLIRNVATAVELFDLDADTITLGALPLFHAFGQTCALNATIAVGGTLTLLPRFDAARALEIIERDRVTVFEGVPTMYSAMLNTPASPTRRRSRSASPAARRCRSRSCAASRSATAAPCSRATGCRRPPRSPPSTAATASASPARSACPVDGVEMKLTRRRRRDRHPRPQRHEGLLGDRRRRRRRRLVPHRRHRPGRRGRLLLHRRPQEGPGHPRRLQRLPARDRGGPLRAPRRARGRGDRDPGRAARRGGRRRRSRSRPRRRRKRSGPSSRNGWPRTSTLASCGSWTNFPRARPARCSSARSRHR